MYNGSPEIYISNHQILWLLKWCKSQYLNSEKFLYSVNFLYSVKFLYSETFYIQWNFYIQRLIFRDIFILSEIFIFRDFFIFSEISVCTEIVLKNSCFKNVKKLLSRIAMMESFWGTLAGLSENLFVPASGKWNSTVDAISGIFQNFKSLQRWRL